MNTSHSAKIYQFPSKIRELVEAKREGDQRGARTPSRQVESVSGGAWYHDAAILEAQRSRPS